MGRQIICDVEADALLDSVTTIWCIVAKDIETQEIFKFHPLTEDSCASNAKTTSTGNHTDFADEFLEFVETVEHFYGHNFIGYDMQVLNNILGTEIKVSQVTDTLVLSRLFRPVTPFKDKMHLLKSDNRLGGHGLAAWGVRLGFPKIDFHDFSKFTFEQLNYCVNDVELNHLVLLELQQEQTGFSQRSIRLEHRVAYLLSQQEQNGFYLDKDACQELVKETGGLLKEMLENLHVLFPQKKKFVRNWKPRFNKDESLSKTSKRILTDWIISKEKSDGSYDLFVMETFNPGSSKQISERLQSLGWVPRKFTPKGAPATDKDTLKDVLEELSDYEEVKYLADYNIIADRFQKASKWLELVKADGRVHGRINPIGAGTHRCSHFDDNMANIAAVNFNSDGDVLHGREGAFGWESRACWAVPKGKVLLGCDAAGIQLRALAHYMGDQDYIKKLLEGDIHTVNQHAAGLPTRAKAKTFIYSWVFGTGDEKMGRLLEVEEQEYDELIEHGSTRIQWGKPLIKAIINNLHRQDRQASRKLVCTILKGHRVKEQFLNSLPALKRFKEKDIPAAAKLGYVVGLDGRKLWAPNEHLSMPLYLQGFESVIMKAAMAFYHLEANKLKIPFRQVSFTHDEFQIETEPECAEELGEIVKQSIIRAGVELGSVCPLDADYKIGKNWAETH